MSEATTDPFELDAKYRLDCCCESLLGLGTTSDKANFVRTALKLAWLLVILQWLRRGKSKLASMFRPSRRKHCSPLNGDRGNANGS